VDDNRETVHAGRFVEMPLAGNPGLLSDRNATSHLKQHGRTGAAIEIRCRSKKDLVTEWLSWFSTFRRQEI